MKKHNNELLIGGGGGGGLPQDWKESSGAIEKIDLTLNPSPAPRSINITPSTNPDTSIDTGEYQQPRLGTLMSGVLHAEWVRVKSLSVFVRL